MAIENVVIGYKADVSDIKRKVTLIQRLNTAMAKNLGSEFTQGVRVIKRELTQVSQSVKPIKLASGKETREIRTFTTVLRQANGQLQTVTQKTAGAGKSLRVLNTSVKSGASGMRTFGQNLKTLLGRALLTIPVWFALRRGIGAVFTTIRDGLKALVDFDKALQKAKRNLQGSSESIEKNFITLRKEVTKLSIETGKSVEDITNAFQKFATVGFDFETSLAGANSATKLSILLFGDAQETATAFARSMRVLIDESKGAKPAGEQLAEVMALTSELWKTNAFELNELTQSLEKFAPVAKTAGFSAEETVKVLSALSTAGLRGGRAGRLLRTSMVRLVTSTDKLASSLGVKVNPEVDRTFDVFLKTLDALQKTRSESGKVAPAFEKIVKSIFGLRSSDAIKGLIALRQNLQAVLGVTGDVSQFNKEFENVNKSLFQLVAQFKNLNREIGKSFVSGLVNGENFDKALEGLIEKQKNLIDDAKTLGFVFNATGQSILGVLTSLKIILGFASLGTTVLIPQIIGLAKETEEAQKRIDALGDSTIAFGEKLQKALAGGLDRTELERFIDELQTIIKLDIDIGIDGSVLRKTLERLQALFDDLPPLQPNIKVSADNVEITTEEQNKLIDALIKDQLQRLKLDGATASQLLKIEDRLRRQFDVGDDIIAQKQRQLDIERAITEEQKERLTFGNESAKLAEIAKTEGIQTAVAIGEVLNGTRDFNTFLRQGGERAEILKKTFADFVKNKELEQFFKGERVLGQPDARGGERIPISEIGRRDFTPLRAEAEFELAKANLGLKESTETNTLAMQASTLAMQKLGAIFTVGGTVTGQDVLRARQGISPNIPTAQKIDLTVTVDGRSLQLVGTEAQIRHQADQLGKLVGDRVAEAFKIRNNNIANNPNSEDAKAVTTRILDT